MRTEHIAKVTDNLHRDPDTIRAVVVCRDGDVEMIGDNFNAEMVVGQVSRMVFEMQFAAMIQEKEPEYLTDKIRSDLDGFANGH